MFDWKTLLKKTPQSARFAILFLSLASIFIGLAVGFKVALVALGIIALMCAIISFLVFID
jgi:hypothetical protein